MGVELQKPFTVEEIHKHPFAVVIAFLIGFILILSGVIGVLWYDNRTANTKCDERVESKTQQIITLLVETRQQRDYFKDESANKDLILKEKTKNNVQKILP